MSDDDSSQNVALMVVAFVVALVLALVIGVAMSRGKPGVKAPAAATAGASAAAAAAALPALDKVYFAVGADALPPQAAAALAKVADAARADAGKAVVISGFHDASGDPAQNAELAKRRAQAVRHALEANGVAPERLVLEKPQQTEGGADPQEARRVELRLR